MNRTHRRDRRLVAIVAVLGLLAALGCRDDAPDAAPPEAPAPPAAAVTKGATTPASAPAAPGRTVALGGTGAAMTVPTGWEARWKDESGLLEVAKGGARFFVERFDPARDESFTDEAATVAMVRSFTEDGLRVESVDHGPVPDGWFVAANTRDDMGRADVHVFVVRNLPAAHLVCRLGPGVGPEDVPVVVDACKSLRSR